MKQEMRSKMGAWWEGVSLLLSSMNLNPSSSSPRVHRNDASIHGWLGSETLYEPIRRLSFESDGETVVDTEDEKSASSGEILTTHVLLKEPSNPIKETISQQLAREVCSLSYEDLSGECISNAKTLILDTVGCALAGSNEPVVETILRTSGFSNKGDTPLFGRR